MINARAKEFAEFCASMLGTDEEKPLILDAAAVNGATISALLDAFKNCYPQESAPTPTKPAATGNHDPLGLRQ